MVDLSPTAWAFVKSDADIAILLGPRGAGKSTAGMVGLLHHAAQFPDAQPIRGAIIRDTFTNLRRTVLETIQDGATRGWWDAEFRDGGAEVILNGGVAKVYLMGMETSSDMTRFQGLELGFAWIEEAAPAADIRGGVDQLVVGSAMSSMRQAGVKPRLQITSNVPDEDHWLLHLTEGTVVGIPDPRKIETFWLTKYDNLDFLTPGYYDRMAAQYIADGRPDLADRLVEGKVGFIASGVAVTPEFGSAHVGPTFFDEKAPIIRGWDFGLNPTCVWLTVTPKGRIYVLGCVVGDNIGLEQLIENAVKPWQARYEIGKPVATLSGGFGRGASTGFTFRDIGDPSGLQREQSNSDRSAVWTLQQMLPGASFEAAPPDWPARRDSVRAVLNRMIEGRPRLIVDPEAKAVVKALRGGWRYHKTPDGKVSHLPIKDIHSHPGDALGYVLSVICPVQDVVARAHKAAVTRPVQPPKTWLGA